MNERPRTQRPPRWSRLGSNAAARLFPLLCLLWLVPRLLPAPSDPPPMIAAALSGVRITPSPETGRYEIHGLPGPGEDLAGLLQLPSLTPARARLAARVEAANDELSLLADRIAGRIEIYPQDGVTGIRHSGILVPFYDQDADRLAQARRSATTRPWEALKTISEIVSARLSEPQDEALLEESIQRRDLTRLLRNVEEAFQGQELTNAQAVEEFRRGVIRNARQAEGPFRRRGPGRVVETILAALLGATLRDALRYRSSGTSSRLALSFAPVLATAAVLLLEGTSLLPRTFFGGVSLLFLPLSFFLGFASSSILGIAARIDGALGVSPEIAGVAPVPREPAPPPHGWPAPAAPVAPPAPRAAAPAPAPAPTPAVPPSEREVADEPPPVPAPAPAPPSATERKLPFERKRHPSTPR